jgi:hypothetical protein
VPWQLEDAQGQKARAKTKKKTIPNPQSLFRRVVFEMRPYLLFLRVVLSIAWNENIVGTPT